MNVISFALRRALGLVLTLFAASFLIFGGLYAAPGDPAALLAGGQRPNPEVLAAIRAEYRLDDPFLLQYGHWLAGLLTGDPGTSAVYRTGVGGLIAERAATTAFLVAYAGALIIAAGLGLGTLAALGGPAVGRTLTVATSAAQAAPPFVVATLLIWLFATRLGWLPVYGAGSGFAGRLEHLTLPAVALALSFTAYVARVTRTAVRGELHSDHVGTAEARGLPRAAVVRRHVLRNAAAPVMTVSGLTLAGLFAGTAIVEEAFGVNGLGSLLVQSAARQDMAVVMALSMLIVTAFTAVNTLVDAASALLDPRVPQVR
ncbi:ABC transporter permease [Nocardiopsis sp. RSe5-2]|uniref:ABC transporter permease n=1 Tax=Nocardiopsis endophytica TaxID=3018445 RepID=A0ABT4U6T3_9ACTN|nr:ABC transporter permease [Nocardiopsis endophytica]MDA2812650.1 ABC transporter permease [Nocardiopsis endophytica]